MASSENQGLQIALIIFVILTLILSVTTFLFFRAYQEAQDKAANRAEDAVAWKAAADDAQGEANALKQLIGFGDRDKMDVIQEGYDEDMQVYASTFPEEKHRYRDVVQLLSASIVDLNKRIAEEQEKVERLTTELTNVQDVAQGKVETHQAAVEQAAQEKATVQATFREQDQRINTEKETVVAQTQEARVKSDAKVQDVLQKLTDAQTQVSGLQNDLKGARQLIDEIRVTKEFKVPHGEIVRVDPAKGTVWINLGRADNLTRQTTFSVHDEGSHKIEQAKAHIEVTRVMLDHLSEARVLKDDLGNPIIRGDKIYSPAWKKGRKVHFALAGVMDVDGDGRSDYQMVRTLILNAGGVIDAEINEEGQRVGEVSIRTRYLVLGEQPTVGSRDAASGRGKEAVEQYSKMISDAKKVGVEQISLERFLDLVGGNVSTDVVKFGRTTNPALYNQRPPDGGRPVSNGSLSDAFRRRRPGDPAGTKDKQSAPKRRPSTYQNR